MSNLFLEATLCGFWSLFYLAIAATNTLDLVNRFAKRPWVERCKANNIEEVEAAVVGIGGSLKSAYVLFVLVITAEMIGAALFAGALLSEFGLVKLQNASHAAFVWNIIVWQAFLVADTIFKTYQFTVVHASLLSISLLSMLCSGGFLAH